MHGYSYFMSHIVPLSTVVLFHFHSLMIQTDIEVERPILFIPSNPLHWFESYKYSIKLIDCTTIYFSYLTFFYSVICLNGMIFLMHIQHNKIDDNVKFLYVCIHRYLHSQLMNYIDCDNNFSKCASIENDVGAFFHCHFQKYIFEIW